MAALCLNSSPSTVRHGGFDEAGGYGVAGYVARPHFAGDRHGETDQSGLRGRVICLACLTHLAENAGDVDDASPALLEHGTDDLLDAQISGGEIGLSTASQSARFMRMTSWSRVMPALFTRISILPNCAMAALTVALTCSSSVTSSAKAADLPPAAAISVDQFVELLLIAGGDGDRCSFFGECKRARASDALRCSGDERYVFGKGHYFLRIEYNFSRKLG